MIAENCAEAIIHNPAMCQRTKVLARKALQGWRNKVLDTDPILIHAGYYAGYYQEPDEDKILLFLTMSDEDYDIAGLGIREYHKESTSNVIVLEEEYPIFPGPKIGHFQNITFKERKNHSERMDAKAWNNYLNSGDEQRFIYRRGEYPTVWISLPNSPIVEVEIWIYDFAGRKSEPVPLEYGLPEMKKPVADSENSVDS